MLKPPDDLELRLLMQQQTPRAGERDDPEQVSLRIAAGEEIFSFERGSLSGRSGRRHTP
ncbi:MAG: hypothetical protein GX837_02990 [Methanomicrobiales archaeon]|nr:hypothetical protein [Methanomicrobiales archaeon]